MTPAALTPEFLAMLRCPENGTPLSLAAPALVAQLNQAISARQLKNKAGRVMKALLEGALVREDRAVAYPILHGIPILLVDDGVLLEQLEK